MPVSWPGLGTGHCPSCGRRIPPEWAHCTARSCWGNVNIWARDVCIMFVSIDVLLEGQVRLVVTTAPGADVLPWDEGFCHRLGQHIHSGSLGCRVESLAANRWNRHREEQWRRLWWAVRNDVERNRAGPRVAPALAYFSWEGQKRGVLHRNTVFDCSSPTFTEAAEASVHALSRLGPAHGFGFTDRKMHEGAISGAYAAGVYAAGKDGSGFKRGGIRDLAYMQGAWPLRPRILAGASRRLTQRTGVTLSSLRARRKAFVLGSLA
jgi:hypothetical protein